MQMSVSPIFVFVMLVGALALVAIVVAYLMRPAKQSRISLAFAVFPALLMLGLYYSLAIHVHQSLGAWPTSNGVQGFPTPLIIHGYFAVCSFIILALVSIFAWPIGFSLCLAVRRWRICVYFLGVYALSCLVCVGAMLLAPPEFLYWWWD